MQMFFLHSIAQIFAYDVVEMVLQSIECPNGHVVPHDRAQDAVKVLVAKLTGYLDSGHVHVSTDV